MKAWYLIFCMILLGHCKSPETKSDGEDKKENQSLKKLENMKYAKTFSISEYPEYYEIQFNNIAQNIPIKKDELPVTSCFIMNTGSIAYINALQKNATIKGIASPDYIYSPYIHEQLRQNKLEVVGSDIGWDFERIIQSKVRFIFCNYQLSLENTYQDLRKNGVNIIFIDEYLETNPLGRSEYLKLFGYLFGEISKAETIFNTIEKNYLQLKNSAKQINFPPKLLSKVMYGDIWYMPEGQSYSAQLYQDGGAHYPWQNTSGNSSLELSFEQVFEQDHDADIWVDVSDVSNANELLAQNHSYSNFSAFKNNQMYALSGRKRGLANDFYESGVLYADSVLEELNYIFRNYEQINKDSLRYYRKLN